MFLTDDAMLILMITQGYLSNITLDSITSGGKKKGLAVLPPSLVFALQKPEASPH